ncbi:MAG TPA: hypothetical protein ENH82_05980, partial [bacterium]|nr:hypothetical protein [bacterium]
MSIRNICRQYRIFEKEPGAIIECFRFIFLPALAVYRLTLSPEWEQAQTKPVSGEKRKKESFMLGYSGELTLLQDKPHTLQLFADRSRSTSSTTFAEKNKSET